MDLHAAREALTAELLAERASAAHWEGELSASALSTATAIAALRLMERNHPSRPDFSAYVSRGRAWLLAHQNADGGWGDTVRSFSNVSTSVLCWAALEITGDAFTRSAEPVARVRAYLGAGGNDPKRLAAMIRSRYGRDRTFSVPILTMAALGGVVPWSLVPRLPYELACLPQEWYRYARLPVVSYALPALIAIGQCVQHHRPTWNPLTGLLREVGRPESLRVLRRIQPESGGYLEAAPLTAFVTMSLASIGKAADPVAQEGARFLLGGVRPDGSWPIDSNLSVWVTTLSVNALAAGGAAPEEEASVQRQWLLERQTRVRHPFTGADAGGWGWSHLPGSVPDADDTPGALIALRNLGAGTTQAEEYAIDSGLVWLLQLQNADGGWPTFCKGWGVLPFDRSGADLTAHALRALAVWRERVPAERLSKTLSTAWAYLQAQQREDGSWLPLWFGNQHAKGDGNPVYGTARVLAAFRDWGRGGAPERRGLEFLVSAQNPDGGWGGDVGCPSSVEETALAIDALAHLGGRDCDRGVAWLCDAIARGAHRTPTPIGFYFAKLWYFEKLYPLAFALSALNRVGG